MSIAYQSEHCTLFHADARDVDIPLCDLLLTDPPYGMNFQSNRRADVMSMLEGDDDAGWVAPALDDIVRKSLRKFRHAYVFGPDELLPERLAAKCQLIWDKEQLGTGDLSLPWSKSFEPITFAVHVSSKANRERGDGKLAARMRKGSVLSVQRKNSRGVTRHPTEKPVHLLMQLIESSSVSADIVLDPFGGSCSTAVASIVLGRRCVIIEKDEQWIDVGIERIKNAEKIADQIGIL